MLNRGAFVQTVGLGAIGTVTWLETPFRSGAGVQGPSATSLAMTTPLTEAIARCHGVGPERVMLSGGSGDVLRAATTTFTSHARALVTGAPGDEAPVGQANRGKEPVSDVPLAADLKLNLVAMLATGGGVGAGLHLQSEQPDVHGRADRRSHRARRGPGGVGARDPCARRRGGLRVRGRPGVRHRDTARGEIPESHHRAYVLQDSRDGRHARRVRDRAGEHPRRDARAHAGAGSQQRASWPRPPRPSKTRRASRSSGR